MTLLDHSIVECMGFDILRFLLWDSAELKKLDSQASDHGNWGFLICTPSHSKSMHDGSNAPKLYGAVGPIQGDLVQETCLAIPLEGASDTQSALAQFALTCGLSIIEKARLEVGDTIVVAGANPLALSVLVAASVQGARTVCLVPDSETESAYRQDIEKLSGEILDFEDVSSFDSKLDALIASSAGKSVYVDALGQPGPVYAMATRLEKFGTLVLCRQEVTTSVLLNIADVHHRKSAQYIYWAKPETIEQALMLSECYRRAARLFHWERVHMPTFFATTRQS